MTGPRGSLGIALLVLWLLAACGEEEMRRDRDPVVARINGDPVTLSEVERRAAWRIHRARLDLHVLLERETERLVEERLLERAARERGLDVESLVQAVEAGSDPVSESDVDRYLEQHPDDVAIAQARPRIRHYLEQTRRIERRLAFVETLRDSAEIEMLLDPPSPARIEIDPRGAPSRGAEDAPITILHFADLSSEDSARSARRLARLEREFVGQIRVLHRSLPAPRDELGLLTAQLARVAESRSAFWALHDQLVASGGVGEVGELASIARSLGLADVLPGLAGDRDSLLQAKRDSDVARELGVRRAPTLFVNGRYFMGLGEYGALRALVEEELDGRARSDRG